MNTAPRSLPPAVLDALARGNLIEAVKLLRSSGIGLKEARDAIEAHLKGKPAPVTNTFSGSGMTQPLPPEVVDALQKGQKIDAVRLMREQSGLGLKEARDAVEAYDRARAPALSDLSPGQVSDTGSGIWWAVALALVCLVGYLILRRFA